MTSGKEHGRTGKKYGVYHTKKLRLLPDLQAKLKRAVIKALLTPGHINDRTDLATKHQVYTKYGSLGLKLFEYWFITDLVYSAEQAKLYRQRFEAREFTEKQLIVKQRYYSRRYLYRLRPERCVEAQALFDNLI